MVAIQYLPVIIGLSETFQHFNDSHLLPQHFCNFLLKAPRPPSPRHSCLLNFYSTPPSIITLVTWVQRQLRW